MIKIYFNKTLILLRYSLKNYDFAFKFNFNFLDLIFKHNI